MGKKSFFNERTEPQIRGLGISSVSVQRGLVDKILSLDASKQALELRFQLIPGRFYAGTRNSAQAARKTYKHGVYLNLSQCRTIEEALYEQRLPHEIRREDFDLKLGSKKEEDIEVQGYAFRPIQGNDVRKRLVPFPWIFEGARLFGYGIKNTEGIKVMPYDDAERVQTEGASVPVSVPAREDKKQRYLIRVDNVAVVDNQNKHVIWPGFTTTYSEGKVSEHSFWSFGYKFINDRESSRNVILYPQDVAAMLGIVRHFLIEEENPVPWNMNPFAKPSFFAANYYRLLCNNVLVRDPKLKRKSKLRKLYIPEKSILLARLIGKFGHDETMFWQKGRDPDKIQDYDWSIPGIK